MKRKMTQALYDVLDDAMAAVENPNANLEEVLDRMEDIVNVHEHGTLLLRELMRRGGLHGIADKRWDQREKSRSRVRRRTLSRASERTASQERLQLNVGRAVREQAATLVRESLLATYPMPDGRMLGEVNGHDLDRFIAHKDATIAGVARCRDFERRIRRLLSAGQMDQRIDQSVTDDQVFDINDSIFGPPTV